MGRLSCLTGTRRSRCDLRFTGHLGQLLWSLLIFVIDAFLSYFGCALLSHVSRTQWLLCAGFFFGVFSLWGFLAPPILHFVYPWFGLALPWHSADPLLYLRFSWHLARLRVGSMFAPLLLLRFNELRITEWNLSVGCFTRFTLTLFFCWQIWWYVHLKCELIPICQVAITEPLQFEIFVKIWPMECHTTHSFTSLSSVLGYSQRTLFRLWSKVLPGNHLPPLLPFSSLLPVLRRPTLACLICLSHPVINGRSVLFSCSLRWLMDELSGTLLQQQREKKPLCAETLLLHFPSQVSLLTPFSAIQLCWCKVVGIDSPAGACCRTVMAH